MKYLVRLIGAILVWPGHALFNVLLFLAINFLSIIWYFDFNHLILLSKKDFYLYMARNEHDISDINAKNGICEWETYSTYYKTPLDILIGKLTKEIHDVSEKAGNTSK